MTRRYGRCARGLRLRACVPHGHWKLTTLVAGLRTIGISAPYVFEGAINGRRFRAYIEQMLAPTLVVRRYRKSPGPLDRRTCPCSCSAGITR